LLLQVSLLLWLVWRMHSTLRLRLSLLLLLFTMVWGASRILPQLHASQRCTLIADILLLLLQQLRVVGQPLGCLLCKAMQQARP
jgi:hypothetical protein